MRQWLIDARKAMELSQYKVAKRAGISQSYYAAIEMGTRGKPLSVDIAKPIAVVLDFPWQRFYEDDETTKNDKR